MPPSAPYAIAARTDKGMRRSTNEDAVTLLELPGTEAAFVLADGMGGLSAGDVAANDTIRIFREVLLAKVTAIDSDLHAALVEAAERANKVVYDRAEAKRATMPETKQDEYERRSGGQSESNARNALMGSTVVAGIVRSGVLHLLHVGDSRAYLLGREGWKRLTFDHSFVEERVRAGDITESEARRSRFRNMITRAIGIAETVTPEIQEIPLRDGDIVLACSDGLNTMLEDGVIAGIVRDSTTAERDAASLCAELVTAANDAGGSDNITVVVFGAADAIAQPFQTGRRASEEPPTVVMPTAVMPTTQVTAPARPAPSQRSASARAVTTPLAPSIVDIDRPLPSSRARKSESAPWLTALAALGGLTLVGLLGLALVPALRGAVAGLLRPPATPPKVVKQSPASTEAKIPADLSKLEYEKPLLFTNRAARGDLLLYTPGAGIYTIGLTTNNLVALKRNGTPVDSGTAVVRFPEQAAGQTTPLYATTDTQGNVYVSRTGRKVIEKYSKDGRLLKTIGGLSLPEAIAVDEFGCIYVVDFSLVKVIRPRTGSTMPSNASSVKDTNAGNAPGPRPGTN